MGRYVHQRLGRRLLPPPLGRAVRRRLAPLLRTSHTLLPRKRTLTHTDVLPRRDHQRPNHVRGQMLHPLPVPPALLSRPDTRFNLLDDTRPALHVRRLLHLGHIHLHLPVHAPREDMDAIPRRPLHRCRGRHCRARRHQPIPRHRHPNHAPMGHLAAPAAPEAQDRHLGCLWRGNPVRPSSPHT